MKIEVNIEKKYFFIILGVILLLSAMFVVYAYNSNFNSSASSAIALGHSADEVVVKQSDGSLKTVQQILSGGVAKLLVENNSESTIVADSDTQWFNLASVVIPANSYSSLMVSFEVTGGIYNDYAKDGQALRIFRIKEGANVYKIFNMTSSVVNGQPSYDHSTFTYKIPGGQTSPSQLTIELLQPFISNGDGGHNRLPVTTVHNLRVFWLGN